MVRPCIPYYKASTYYKLKASKLFTFTFTLHTSTHPCFSTPGWLWLWRVEVELTRSEDEESGSP